MNTKQLTGKKVLIAEDDKDFLDLMAGILMDAGADVTGAENGRNAIEVLKMKKFDILVTDLRMPDGDGISLIKNIHTHLTEKPKIFICSAFNDLSAEELKELGVVAVFSKPFDRKKMIETIASAL